MLKKNPKYSKRINYDALKDLFVDGVDIGAFANMDGKTDDIPLDESEGADQGVLSGLYSMDDKSEGGEPMVIIEENNELSAMHDDEKDDEKDGDADIDGVDGDGDFDSGWGDDGYEQEV